MLFSKVKNYPIIVYPTNNDIVNMRIIVNAGAADEDADSWGTAHYLEHMFFKGTKKRDYKEINKITSRLGDINAYTSRYQTVYLFTFLKDSFEESAEILTEMAFQPAFPQEEFDKEMGVIIEECNMYLDRPTSYFFNVVTEHYMGSEIGHPIVGTMESIKATNLEKLQRFVDKFYNPANTLIAVCGNVSADQVKNTLDKFLPDMEGVENKRKKPDLNMENHSFHHHSKQSIITMAFKGVTTRDEADMGFLPDVFFNAFGGGMHSLLFDRLREELGLCYSVSAWHGSCHDHGTAQVFTMLDEKNIDLAKEEIEKIIKQVRQDGFSDELLNIAKLSYMFGYGKRLQTSSGINRLTDDYFALKGFPMDRYIDYEDRKQKLDNMTNKDMIEFANRVFDESPKFMQMTHQA